MKTKTDVWSEMNLLGRVAGKLIPEARITSGSNKFSNESGSKVIFKIKIEFIDGVKNWEGRSDIKRIAEGFKWVVTEWTKFDTLEFLAVK